ncbi:MAG: SUMF1/EgtB/PvdO family nonheme iron enzyme, partial [Alphaproteobacteria bacterium]|nr:SUMF1/EgtB/PvdO family nonheme iron enzyme [Alphaproteobacteria bacterium]
QCQHANGADLALRRLSDGWNWGAACDDGAAHAATVGSYAPNGFGLHDMQGNVWEWVEDCWNDGYTDAPADGSAWTSGDCSNRTARGGSWSNGPRFFRLAVRRGNETTARVDVYGFRVARTID